MSSSQFSQADLRILAKSDLYRGFFAAVKYRVQHRRFDGTWTEPFEREVFERGDAACVLLFDPQAEAVVLVEQFRLPAALAGKTNPWLLEMVAGIIEPDETPAAVVEREAVEEAGVSVRDLIPIANYLASPGGCSERVWLFCGRVDSREAQGVHGLAEENEDIRVCVLSLADAYAALVDGRIDNAATMIALLWLQLNESQVRARWLNGGA